MVKSCCVIICVYTKHGLYSLKVFVWHTYISQTSRSFQFKYIVGFLQKKNWLRHTRKTTITCNDNKYRISIDATVVHGKPLTSDYIRKILTCYTTQPLFFTVQQYAMIIIQATAIQIKYRRHGSRQTVKSANFTSQKTKN